MGFEPKPTPAGDINQVSEVAAALNRRASGFNHSANVCTVPRWRSGCCCKYRTFGGYWIAGRQACWLARVNLSLRTLFLFVFCCYWLSW